jgi:signal transduction histidine kinase
MTLAHRVWLASAILAVLVGGAFVALILAASSQREATDREQRSKDITAASLQLEKLVLDLETGVNGLTVTGNASYVAQYEGAKRQLDQRINALRQLVAEDVAQRQRVQLLEGDIDLYLEYSDALLTVVRETPGIARDSPIVEVAKGYSDGIRERFRLLRENESRATAEAAAEAERRTDVAVVVGGAAITASMALIALFGVVLARSIGRPVRAVAEGASRLAAGDLSLRLPVSGSGEIADLTRSFNAMAERLEESRHELEEQNAELRESERMKTELVSIVSHELRTPLASVLGFTALLLKRDFDPASRRHYHGIVDAQARRLAALLEDFLDVQRIEHEGLELAREQVDLATLLDEQAELYAAQSPKHHVEVELETRPLTVRGDPNRLAQVVGNLLSNAIKYSPEGGRVELAAKREGEDVRILVRDEGLGIPEEQQSRIFTKFFRGDAGATGITGTGLGLAVSRQIVEAHGGRIGFDSDPGEGSTFWLELPGARYDLSTNETKEAGG